MQTLCWLYEEEDNDDDDDGEHDKVCPYYAMPTVPHKSKLPLNCL